MSHLTLEKTANIFSTFGGAAFIAINSGVHTGAIAIDVCGNTTEAAASSVLNASGSVPASYSSIIIRPVGGAARTITAATTAGSPMIDFNGADFVTTTDGTGVVHIAPAFGEDDLNLGIKENLPFSFKTRKPSS